MAADLRWSPCCRLTGPMGAPASSPARAAPSAPQPVLVPTAPPHGTPASSPAYAAPSAPQAVSCRPRRPLERRRPRRPVPHRRSLSQSSCRLRRPMERRRPRRPTPHPRPLRRSRVDRAAPWSAGILAGPRRTVGPSASLRADCAAVPSDRGEAHAPCPPAAVAGEDTGAPWGWWPVRTPALHGGGGR